MLARKLIKAGAATVYGPEISLLMHFDGTDGASVFPDSSSYAKTISVAAGTVTTEVEDKVFGTAAGLFAATSYLTVPHDATLNFGTGDYCIDFWMKRATTGVNIILAKGPSTNPVFQIYMSNTLLYLYTNGVNRRNITGPAVNTWGHVEISRTSGVVYLFLDGVTPGGVAETTNADSTSDLWIGRDKVSSYFPNGRIDELRIQKGTFGHTANFTPPVAPY